MSMPSIHELPRPSERVFAIYEVPGVPSYLVQRSLQHPDGTLTPCPEFHRYHSLLTARMHCVLRGAVELAVNLADAPDNLVALWWDREN